MHGERSEKGVANEEPRKDQKPQHMRHYVASFIVHIEQALNGLLYCKHVPVTPVDILPHLPNRKNSLRSV